MILQALEIVAWLSVASSVVAYGRSVRTGGLMGILAGGLLIAWGIARGDAGGLTAAGVNAVLTLLHLRNVLGVKRRQ